MVFFSFFRFSSFIECITLTPRMVRGGKGMLSRLFQKAAIFEDFADRLNHFWTFGLLLLLAGIISWKQSYNKPMVCWAPSGFSFNMIQYAESLCWESNAIYYEIGSHSKIPIVSSHDIDNSVSYVALYKWLPLLFCLQALLFKLPHFLLLVLHGYTGISFDKVAGLTSGYERLDMDDRQSLGRQIAQYVNRWCQQFLGLPPWRLLTVLYLIVKLLYCVNIIVQVILLNNFLLSGQLPNEASLTSVGDIFTGNLLTSNVHDIQDLPMLPKAAMCDFSIQQVNNIQTYRLNCHIPANRLNEHVMMFMWVWFVFVAVVTTLSLVVWTLRTLIPIPRKRFVFKLYPFWKHSFILTNYRTDHVHY